MSIHCFQRTNTGQSHRGALNQACRGTPPREMQCAVLYGAQLCVHKFGTFARRELYICELNNASDESPRLSFLQSKQDYTHLSIEVK